MSGSSRRSNEIPKKRGRSDVTNGRRDSERSDRHRAEKSKEVFTPKAEKSKETLAEELKTKEFVYEAKMQIQERMKGLGLPLHQLSAKSDKFNETVLRPDEAIAFAQLHMEKVQRLNEMKTKLAKSLSNVNVKTPSLVLESMASDNKWGILSEQQSKLKPVKKEEANFEEKNAQTTPILKKTIEAEPDSSTGPVVDFQDPRLYLKPALRKRRHFDFKQPGEYEKMAKMQRSKAKLEKLQSEIEKAAKQTGISSAVKLAIVTPSGLPETSTGEYIPEVEWWDEVVLGNGKRYENIPSVVDIAPLDRYADTITDLVEHPIQLKPPDEPVQPQYLKASLTKKERKKLRRQNRREAIKEKTEKIRLGLDKPPEPKLKISNLMRVLGTDAIQDPTKMEAVVRKQMAEREQKHIDENRSRKLTREEKASKAIRKVAEDTSLAVHVAVYKVKSLANPAKKFKVLMNAKQLQMTGTIIQLEDINVIIVEGGPKQQKFYKNLMLNRIKWSEEIAGQRHVRKGAQLDEDSQQNNQGKLNECTLVWEGIVQKRAFNGEPRFIQVSNHKQAREVLDKYGVAHYWDLCYATSVLLSDDK
uniref:Uncharacterized protein n=1 Tax=Meloidogyne enterolobii TaxID=390850 RepID=A0A6V7UKL7_MELEN|nr:unnamed protein product [Meloidogyne enterolobii]